MIGQILYGPLDLTDYPYITDPESDLGSPPPDQMTVARLLVDGDVVTGARSGNRTLQLRVTIAAASRAEFSAAEAALFAEVDKPSNSLRVLFGDGDGTPVVIDTFRGQLAPAHDADLDYTYTRSYTLTAAAAPFFRSPDPITLAPTTTSTQIDSFDSLTGLSTSQTPSLDTTTFIEGTASVKQRILVSDQENTWSRAVGSLNITGTATIVLRALADYPYPIHAGRWTLKLSSSGGRSSTWRTTQALDHSTWDQIPFDLTVEPTATTGGGVNLAAVTGWALGTYQVAGFGPGPVAYIWVDDLRAYPAGSGAVVNGSAQLFFAKVKGAARTPVSLEVDTGGSGGLLIANTPAPPEGYDPVLLPVTASPGSLSFTRKAVTLRRPAPDASTYVVVVYAQISDGGGTLGASASISGDPTAVVASCSRTVTPTDPDYLARNTGKYALLSIGELTLPPSDVDPQNTAATVTITLSQSTFLGSGGVTIKGAWLLWIGGENTAVFLPGASSVANFYVDAPTLTQMAGTVRGGASRAAAFDLSAGRVGQVAVNFTPGPNHLLVVALPKSATPTTNPTPTTTCFYFSRWLTEQAA